MLAVGVGILHPAPAMYYWYIYDTDKGPSVLAAVARSDCSYRSWEAALEAGTQAVATRGHLAAGLIDGGQRGL